MENQDFRREAPRGTLLIRVHPAAAGESEHEIYDIDGPLVEKAAPKLAATQSNDLSQQDEMHGVESIVNFHGTSSAAVICLLRFIYIGDYLAAEDLLDRPCSMLLHFQLFKLGQEYEIADLTSQAYSYAMRECELATSNPPMVIDLCDAIRFLYLELPDADSLFDVIVNYCIQCYIYHGMAKSEEFRQTIFEAPDFHRLLLKRSLERSFDAEGAMDIINVQVCKNVCHESYDKAVRDATRFMCHLHNSNVHPTFFDKRPIWRQPTEYVLVHRPRFPTAMPKSSEDVAAELQADEWRERDHFVRFAGSNPINNEPSQPGPSRPRFNLPPPPPMPKPEHFKLPSRPALPKPEDFSTAPGQDSLARWSSFPQRPDDSEIDQKDNNSHSDYYWEDPRFNDPGDAESQKPLIDLGDEVQEHYDDPSPPRKKCLTVTNFSDADLETLPEPKSEQKGSNFMRDMAAPPAPIPHDPHPKHSMPVSSVKLTSALNKLAAHEASPRGNPSFAPYFNSLREDSSSGPNLSKSQLTMLIRQREQDRRHTREQNRQEARENDREQARKRFASEADTRSSNRMSPTEARAALTELKRAEEVVRSGRRMKQTRGADGMWYLTPIGPAPSEKTAPSEKPPPSTARTGAGTVVSNTTATRSATGSVSVSGSVKTEDEEWTSVPATEPTTAEAAANDASVPKPTKVDIKGKGRAPDQSYGNSHSQSDEDWEML